MSNKRKRKRILVDMDGILTDLLGKWLATYNEEHDDNVTAADITTWNTHEHVKIGKAMYRIPSRPNYFDNIAPIKGAIEGFKELQYEHELLVCSSPYNACSARAKYAWCKKHLGLAPRDVTLTHKKTWLAASVDVIIDDKPDTIRAFHAAGKQAVTIAYPYNESVSDLCALRADGYQDTEAAWAQVVDFLID
jgi:5'(3')-deoxyribonucleotidase